MEKLTPKGAPTTPPKHPLAKFARFFALTVMNIVFMLVSAFLIHQYDPSSTGRKSISPLTIFDRTVSLPAMITHPTFPVVLFACIFYGSALSSFPNPPHDDPYQGYFLMAGGVAGYLGATNFGWDDKFVMVLKSFVPTTVTVALVISLVFHAVLRRVQEPGVKDAQAGVNKKKN